MLEILVNCARADLAYCLAEAERTCSPDWQQQAAEARQNVETLEALMRVPA